MMKWTMLFMTAVCVLSMNSYAILSIDKIEIVQAQDFNAEWNHTTGTLEWKPQTDGSGAELYASATLRRSDGQEFEADVLIHANFSSMTDYSAGDWASATFSAISDWDMIFFESGVQVAKIEGIGILGNVYTEIEGEANPFAGFPGQPARNNPDNLYGDVVVDVTNFDFAYYGASWADESGGEAKMESWMVLPIGANFSNYTSQSYSTNLTTLWLDADETVIPEPATLALLGLGGLLLRRRKA